LKHFWQMNIVLIKYAVYGNFDEFQTYNLILDTSKISPIYSLDDRPVYIKSCLDLLEGKTVELIYRGISRYDSMNLFVLDLDKNIRNYKLNEILNLK
jgi:hypothetical protein